MSLIKPRYLTKSLFKLACECPTKLFYTGKSEYPSTAVDNPFLAALAEGGFQVGELAKQYYPSGHDIKALDNETALKETQALLTHENVVIFEPAIAFDNLLIRIDILVKTGHHFELIEVKAKSYSAMEDKDFLNTKGQLSSTWKPYIFDAAFQKHVLKSAFPQAMIDTYLMLVDKTAVCPSDGLNQKFKIINDKRTSVELIEPLTTEELNSKLLKKVRVDDAINVTYANELQEGMPAYTFIDNIHALAEHYEKDIKISPVIGKKCKTCEFTCTSEDEALGKVNGKHSCWQEQLHWEGDDLTQPTVLDIWNFRQADNCIQDGLVKLSDITEDDIGPEAEIEATKRAPLSTKERQWMQVQKVQQHDTAAYFDSDSMAKEFASWTYPLHFIDFETSAVAIPFYKGMTPYEGIAFQFSHHQVEADGSVAHAGEFLNTEPGVFPNFEFMRALYQQLKNDEGTIFMYSPHENTFLNTIYKQLQASNEPDKDELCGFIKTITTSTSKSKSAWNGNRQMVDLLQLVKKFYYDPATKGSNSIKYVLPAILNSSDYLKAKYSQPIYGTSQLVSRNFTNHAWIKLDDDGKVIDPYQLLPEMAGKVDEDDDLIFSQAAKINNGGLALTAYAKMQFTQMSDNERLALKHALLKYCELDTWAMVAIYEGWSEFLNSK